MPPHMVPTLTEVVQAPTSVVPSEVPVLSEVVEPLLAPTDAAPAVPPPGGLSFVTTMTPLGRSAPHEAVPPPASGGSALAKPLMPAARPWAESTPAAPAQAKPIPVSSLIDSPVVNEFVPQPSGASPAPAAATASFNASVAAAASAPVSPEASPFAAVAAGLQAGAQPSAPIAPRSTQTSPAPDAQMNAPAVVPALLAAAENSPGAGMAMQDAEEIAQIVLVSLQKQIDQLLEYRSKEIITPALKRLSEALIREMRDDLSATLQDVVSRAVAQEIARRRAKN